MLLCQCATRNEHDPMTDLRRMDLRRMDTQRIPATSRQWMCLQQLLHLHALLDLDVMMDLELGLELRLEMEEVDVMLALNAELNAEVELRVIQ